MKKGLYRHKKKKGFSRKEVIMRFYSDELKKLFDSEEELQKAETEHAELVKAEKLKKEQAVAQRKLDAEKVEKAFEEYNNSAKNYKEELKKFVEKWGQYHYSTTDPNFKHFLGFWNLF